MADLNWWTFLDVPAQEAQHLGEAERAQVAEALDAAPAPGGMLAASCMCRVARRRWTYRERYSFALTYLARIILAAVWYPTPSS